MDSQWVEVGQRICSLRKSYGYTQERLAEMADISVQFLIQIEHGRKTMKMEHPVRQKMHHPDEKGQNGSNNQGYQKRNGKGAGCCWKE